MREKSRAKLKISQPTGKLRTKKRALSVFWMNKKYLKVKEVKTGRRYCLGDRKDHRREAFFTWVLERQRIHASTFNSLNAPRLRPHSFWALLLEGHETAWWNAQASYRYGEYTRCAPYCTERTEGWWLMAGLKESSQESLLGSVSSAILWNTFDFWHDSSQS